mmetsp:Transcript_23899/g.56946  ORF Transcript_23899/g.56946 Transcript_23899/m.56946 type:complete len:294 (-) Transcript_23899:58-939(-)
MVMVIGPTPPGTGVMSPATWRQPSKSQSPTSRYPAFLVGSSTGLVPTSMSAAPGFTHSRLIMPGCPAAATTMSACRTMSSMPCVRECTMVTVASLSLRSMAAGRPTMLLRPTTTARLPLISTPQRSSRTMQPMGVHGTKSGSRPFMQSLPMLSGWKPSTSFSMLMAERTASSSICEGNGSWTKMPWTSGSALYLSTTAMSCSWVMSSGRSEPKEAIPTSSQAFFFILTYVCESFRSPTITTASPGTLPCTSFIRSTACLISERTAAATFLPDMTFPSTKAPSKDSEVVCAAAI